jgi:hypothetical protein
MSIDNMNIEEIIALYQFLTTSGFLGDVIVWFLLSVFLGSSALWGKDKLDIPIKIKKWKLMGIISIVVGFIVLGLHLEASYRNYILRKANCVKSEFVTYGYKIASDSTITSRNFHCNCSKKDILRILEHHPDEFIKVKTDDRVDGIRIIDDKALDAINKYNQSHVPFIKSRVLDYMDAHEVDILSYSVIRDCVNSDFDDEWIELMLSQYDSLFIPFNIMDDQPKYGDTHFVKRKRKAPAKDGDVNVQSETSQGIPPSGKTR